MHDAALQTRTGGATLWRSQGHRQGQKHREKSGTPHHLILKPPHLRASAWLSSMHLPACLKSSETA